MIGVIVNPQAGYVVQHGVDQLRAQIAKVVPDARVIVLQPHDDLDCICRDLLASGVTCVAAVGGDGTVSSVAANLIDSRVPLGVVPGGTLNHFARDVGVGRDVPRAIETLAELYVERVDVGMVNERIFLNNSTIGLYPEIVRVREGVEHRLGKLRAMLRAGLIAFGRTKWTNVHISSDGRDGNVRTRMLFVGNNRYELDLLHLGRRESIQDGVLSCYILDAPSRFQLARTVLASLSGKRRPHKYFRSIQATEMTVTPSGEREVDVAADGEVLSMKAPLVYTIRPMALRVVVPKSSRESRQ